MIVPYLNRRERKGAAAFTARRLSPRDVVESSSGFTSGIFSRESRCPLIVRGMTARDADPIVIMLIRTLSVARQGPVLLP